MRKFLTLLFAASLTHSVMTAQDLYLMGYGNVWDVQPSCRFIESDGVYTLHIGRLDQTTIPYGFKIAEVNDDDRHSWSNEWGTAESVRIDTPVKCAPGYDDGTKNNNFYLPGHYNTQNISSLESATLIFDKSKMTLTIDPDMYLAGECTDWKNTYSQWCFTNEGNGIHTLDVKSVNGRFKIAAGATEAWTVEYGGYDGMMPGRTYNLIPGPGNDMSVSGSFSRIVLDRNTNTICFVKEDGGSSEPADPPVTPADPSERGPELYLMGEWNNWTPDEEAYHFTQNNICEYVLEVPSLSGEFKVTSPGWKNQFGCDFPIEIGKTYSCVRADNGHNMTLAQGNGTNVTIVFDYKNQTIKVNCLPALYLVGDFNDWVPSQSYQFSLINGKYELRTRNFQGDFRIESIDRSVIFGGTSGASSVGLDEEYHVFHGTDNKISFGGLNNPDNRMLITLNPNAGDISTIVNLFNEDLLNDSPVEYFNLQGQAVRNPGFGIYIRKTGNKVEKIVIK